MNRTDQNILTRFKAGYRVHHLGLQQQWNWFRRAPVAAFLICLVVTLAVIPFQEQFQAGEFLDALTITVLLLSGLLAIGKRRLAVVLGVLLVLPAIAAKWMNCSRPDLISPPAFLIPGLLFVLFVVVSLLRFILHAKNINSEVLCAGAAGYLLLGLLWGFAYSLIARSSPNAFVFAASPNATYPPKGSTMIYFSFITLATVGYGDIVPVAGAARMLAMLEAVTGTFYMAILIARLVALYSAPLRQDSIEKGTPVSHSKSQHP